VPPHLGQSPVPLHLGQGTSSEEPGAPPVIIGIPLALVPHSTLPVPLQTRHRPVPLHTGHFILFPSYWLPLVASAHAHFPRNLRAAFFKILTCSLAFIGSLRCGLPPAVLIASCCIIGLLGLGILLTPFELPRLYYITIVT